jgi:hypothetical protein
MVWISVADRLPELLPELLPGQTSIDCVVYCPRPFETGIITTARWVIPRRGRGKPTPRWEDNSGRILARAVSHWIALPAPPE